MSNLSGHSKTIQTPDGVSLSVQEWGNPEGRAIVFIHGISQCHLSWRRQYESLLASSFRMITYDIRGHGQSSQPDDAASYQENQRWAQELNCVIEGTNLKRPVLVAWSYAGRVVCDYLQTYGDTAISGINFVSASTKTSREWASAGGKLLRDMTSDDPAISQPATKLFLRMCMLEPLTAADFETMLAYNLITPAKIRGYMLARTTPYEEHLRQVKVPVLITHGEQDQIVVPAVSQYTASVIPHARVSLYENTAHAPFWEDAPRFNEELKTFVNGASQFPAH